MNLLLGLVLVFFGIGIFCMAGLLVSILINLKQIDKMENNFIDKVE